MVDITWHGHSCFEVRGKSVTVMFDPFGGIGLPEPKAKADIVLCTHSHPDHNNVKQVLKEGGLALEGFVGAKDVRGVSVSGVATFHDAAGGSQRGKNSVYVVRLDGLKLCHLGDLGHDLTAEQAKEIGRVDVLFTPVAGGATIGPDIAWSVIAKLSPRVVIPMHYSSGRQAASPWLSRVMPIPLNEFLKDKENIEETSGPTLTVTIDSLPKRQKIVVPKLTA